jgi:ankyrin repeat protein
MCGMSRRSEIHTALLIERGGDIEAIDTYGFRPLHRMASNNLAIGARALLDAGAKVDAVSGGGQTPMDVARQSGARAVQAVLIDFKQKQCKDSTDCP